MSPGVKVQEFDLAAYVPAGSRAIVGLIGPATKGPINALGEFTDEGNFVSAHGRPVNNQHACRAAIRYLRFGNRLKFVRVAGSLFSTAFVESWKVVGGVNIPLLTFSAISPGTWGNDTIKINITHNGDPAISYNVWVYFQGRLVERFDNVTNATVANEVNRESSYVTVAVHQDAGIVFPDTTVDSDTEAYVPLVLAHGDDGAFASSRATASSTGGVSARSDFGHTLSDNGTVDYSGLENRVVVPGSFVVTDGTETFTDNQDGTLTGSDGGEGKIKYQTGEWSLAFAVAPTTDVDVVYVNGTHEVLGSTSPTILSYSGLLGRSGVQPSSICIFDPRRDQVEIGDGATDTYAAVLGLAIVPGSLSVVTKDILGHTMTVTDDGEGNLVGNMVTGTIDYATGDLDVQFTAFVKNLEKIWATYFVVVTDDGAGLLSGDRVTGTINYQTGAWTLVHTFVAAGDYMPGLQTGGGIAAFFGHVTVIGYGDAGTLEFSGKLKEYPIKPGSLKLYYAASPTLPLLDDGLGVISGAGGEGTIDYRTGEYSVTFLGAPALGFPIYITSNAVLLHFTSIFAGPIGNEREVLEDGLYVHVDMSPSTPEDITPGAQWYRVRIFFNDGTGATPVETFDALRSMDELVQTVNDADNGSEYVRIERTEYLGEADVAYDSFVGQKVGMNGAFTSADVIGTKVGTIYTGMQLFSNSEAVPLNFLSAPGMHDLRIQQAGIAMAEARRLVWIVSIPQFTDPYDARDFVNGEYNASTPGGIARPTAKVPYPFKAAVDSSHAFCTFAWVNYYDSYTEEEVTEPGEGDVLALIAQIDNRFKPWMPIAGLQRGALQNTTGLLYSPDDGERKAIYGVSGTRTEVVNPFVNFIGQGLFLYGQCTMARSPKATDRLHARWTANLIADSILQGGRVFPFELNDEILWRKIRSLLRDILEPIKAERGIIDFRIVCDATTNTPQVIAAKTVIAKVFIQFVEVAELIEFQMIFTPTTSSFDEVAPLG